MEHSKGDEQETMKRRLSRANSDSRERHNSQENCPEHASTSSQNNILEARSSRRSISEDRRENVNCRYDQENDFGHSSSLQNIDGNQKLSQGLHSENRENEMCNKSQTDKTESDLSSDEEEQTSRKELLEHGNYEGKKSEHGLPECKNQENNFGHCSSLQNPGSSRRSDSEEGRPWYWRVEDRLASLGGRSLSDTEMLMNIRAIYQNESNLRRERMMEEARCNEENVPQSFSDSSTSD